MCSGEAVGWWAGVGPRAEELARLAHASATHATTRTPHAPALIWESWARCCTAWSSATADIFDSSPPIAIENSCACCARAARMAARACCCCRSNKSSDAKSCRFCSSRVASCASSSAFCWLALARRCAAASCRLSSCSFARFSSSVRSCHCGIFRDTRAQYRLLASSRRRSASVAAPPPGCGPASLPPAASWTSLISVVLRALACSSFSTSLVRSRSSDFWWTSWGRVGGWVGGWAAPRRMPYRTWHSIVKTPNTPSRTQPPCSSAARAFGSPCATAAPASLAASPAPESAPWS